MIQVAIYDQFDTRFADLDMPGIPRVDDEVEIALPNEPLAKHFRVERVVYKMVYKTEHVQNDIDTPWYWEIRLYGTLWKPIEALECTCAQGVTKCDRHGKQPAHRDICPKCRKAVLAYCAAGVYCTTETCDFAS
jgi:hypothetical protein